MCYSRLTDIDRYSVSNISILLLVSSLDTISRLGHLYCEGVALPRSGHIRRGHQASVKQFHNHPLLTIYPCHSPMDSLEVAIGDDDMVAHLVLDVGRRNGDDVGILDGGETDEVVHRLAADGEGRIAVRVVLTLDGMVVVVTQQGLAFGGVALPVIEQSIHLVFCVSDKHEGREKRFCDDAPLSLFPYLLAAQRNVTFHALGFDERLCLNDTTIRNSQNKPLSVCIRHILYRHPTFVLRDGGRTRGKFCTWTR